MVILSRVFFLYGNKIEYGTLSLEYEFIFMAKNLINIQLVISMSYFMNAFHMQSNIFLPTGLIIEILTFNILNLFMNGIDMIDQTSDLSRPETAMFAFKTLNTPMNSFNMLRDDTFPRCLIVTMVTIKFLDLFVNFLDMTSLSTLP